MLLVTEKIMERVKGLCCVNIKEMPQNYLMLHWQGVYLHRISVDYG